MARMRKTRKRKSRPGLIRRFMGPFFFAAATFYLVFHIFNGDRGLYAYLKQSKQLESLQVELADAKAKRMELENRVRLMSDASLDLDMLDEQARHTLGYSHPNEVMVLIEHKE